MKKGDLPFKGKSQDDAKQRVQIATNVAKTEARERRTQEPSSDPKAK